jgi:hypothetical protein
MSKFPNKQVKSTALDFSISLVINPTAGKPAGKPAGKHRDSQ